MTIWERSYHHKISQGKTIMNFNLTKFTYQNLFTETQINAKFSYDKLERINSLTRLSFNSTMYQS